MNKTCRLAHATLLPLVSALLFPAIAAADPAASQITATEIAHIGSLERTVETIQAGPSPIDTFKLYRVVSHGGLHHSRGTIILAPPLSSGFQNYETTDSGDYDDSFVGFFAKRGFDVWGYSQRVQDLPAGSCESQAVDCSVMADWGLAQLLADGEYVRQRVEAEHPGELPVVGGMSLGSMLGLATVDAHPNDYAGVIAVEGTVYTTDPNVIAIATPSCQALTAAISGGATYDGQGLLGFKLLSQLADQDPGGSSPIPAFAGLSNQQAWVASLSVPNPGPTAPRGDYFFTAGDVGSGTLFFANPTYLHRNIATSVDYGALATVRDVDCGLAGDRTFSSNLGAFQGHVFVIADQHGFGSMMNDTASLLTSADVAFRTYPGFGHIDSFFATAHRALLERPLLHWLETRAFD
jgi:pimeloyl-ACP methyl ester carboxylesterase